MAESVPAPAPSFAQLLRRYRRAAGLTQEQLAERAGLSARAVSDLERGENRAPRRDTLDLLADALELPPADRVALEEMIVRTRVGTPPQTAADPAPTPAPDFDDALSNLPAQPTPFIGREHEIAVVRARLLDPETRLLTLTGPGGVGKTRLALQAAAAARAGFSDGIVFVALAALSDPDLVLPTIAQAAGVAEEAGHPLGDTLAAALRGKRLLLVLDNFEQVLAAAVAVQALLAAPGVTMLATSREPLHVRGERVHPVGPLAVPRPPLPPLATLSQYEAVKLFIARAMDADPAFAITNETAPAVAEICARLDGLPLAIELAAARVRLLPPEALLARLGNRLKVATGGARDLPARQQALRAAIDWSHDLLDPGEQTLFARLAVFVGGRTLDAIEAVCDADGDLPLDALDGVESLLDKSLLRRDEDTGGEPRFVMLETIHEYSWERLTARDEVGAMGRAHATYYRALAERAEPELIGSRQGVWLTRLEAEHDNLRAALSWSQERGDAETASHVAAALWRFWSARGHQREGYNWIERTLGWVDRARIEDAVLAELLSGAGMLATDYGDYERAEVLLEECLALSEKRDDVGWVARILSSMGVVAIHRRAYDRAAELLNRALTSDRNRGDQWSLYVTMLNLAAVARFQGDLDRARGWLDESLALVRGVGDTWGLAVVLENIAIVAIKQGDYERARTYFHESVASYRAVGHRKGVIDCLEELADMLSAQRHIYPAVRLLGAAAALREQYNADREPNDQDMYDVLIASTRMTLGDDAFEAAWGAGRMLSLDEALTDALG